MKRLLFALVFLPQLAFGQAGRPPVLPSTEPFASTWSTQTSVPPAKSAVYSWAHIFDIDGNGKVNVLDTTAGVVVSDANGVISNGTPGVDYTTPTSAEDPENKNFSGLLNTFHDIPAVAITGAIPLNVQLWDGTGNITVTNGKNVLELTAALGASRTVVLPAASSITGGIVLRFLNLSGSATAITSTNTLSFARGGSDTINGATANIIIPRNIGELDFGSNGATKWAVNDDTGSFRSVIRYAKSVTVQTSGTVPADIATITIPFPRWRLISSGTCGFYSETAAGTLAGASFAGFTAAGGTGTTMLATTTGPTAASTWTQWNANNLANVTTSSTLYVRQSANSANAGTLSFEVMIIPVP